MRFKRFAAVLCLLALLAAPALADGLEITSVQLESNGFVTVTWQNEDGKGPYSLYYMIWHPETQTLDVAVRLDETTDGNRFTYKQLVPGVSYTLAVRDSEKNIAYKTVELPEKGRFQTSQKTKAVLSLKYKTKAGAKDRSAKTSKKLSASAIRKNLERGYAYGLGLKVKFNSKTSETSVHDGVVAVWAPNGFLWSEGVRFTFNRKKGTSSEFPFLMSPLFPTLISQYGGIPTGEYKMKLFLEGQLYLEESFTIKE